MSAAVWALGSEHLGNTGPWSVETLATVHTGAGYSDTLVQDIADSGGGLINMSGT